MAGVRAQAVQLLCAIVYHSAVAAFCFPWHVLRCLVGLNSNVASNMKTATFWEGDVYHIRRKPVLHQFKCAAQFAMCVSQVLSSLAPRCSLDGLAPHPSVLLFQSSRVLARHELMM